MAWIIQILQMLVGVETNQFWQETHMGKSNKGSNNLGRSAITSV